MHISSTLSMSRGRRLAAEPAAFASILTTADRNRLAAELDREADLALAEGKPWLADRLAWRAAGLRGTGA